MFVIFCLSRSYNSPLIPNTEVGTSCHCSTHFTCFAVFFTTEVKSVTPLICDRQSLRVWVKTGNTHAELNLMAVTCVNTTYLKFSKQNPQFFIMKNFKHIQSRKNSIFKSREYIYIFNIYPSITTFENCHLSHSHNNFPYHSHQNILKEIPAIV